MVIINWLSVFLWCRLIFFFSSIPGIETGLGFWDIIVRKGAHIFEFGTLCVLLYLAWKNTIKMSAVKFFVFVSGFALLYAASDEFHQTFVANRDGNIRDVLIDAAGIFLATFYIFKKGGLCERKTQETGKG
ncbi:MAG: VanZ family protein [bacterium]